MFHSAMKKYGGVSQNEKTHIPDMFHSENTTIFQHDICSDCIPDVFYSADAVFTIMAWRAGYKKYIEKSIAENTTFDEYCDSINRVIRAIKKPSFVITNKTFANKLHADRYENILYCEFNSNDLCAIWHYCGDIPKDTETLQKWVGNNYETVLDFCCGYGTIADYCRRTILTDINTTCIKTLVKRANEEYRR